MNNSPVTTTQPQPRPSGLPPVFATCYACRQQMERDYTTKFDLTGQGKIIVDICDPCYARAEKNTETGGETMCDSCLDYAPCYNLDGCVHTCYKCQVRQNVAEMHEDAKPLSDEAYYESIKCYKCGAGNASGDPEKPLCMSCFEKRLTEFTDGTPVETEDGIIKFAPTIGEVVTVLTVAAMFAFVWGIS